MAEQLKLFPGVLAFRQIWDLKKIGIQQAADLVIELLNEGHLPVMEFEIAKRRLNLGADPVIPEGLADSFTTIVNQIHDNRFPIKDRVEELSEYRLVIVDATGHTARGAGRRHGCGFNVRDSHAGRHDDAVQINMNLGGIRAAMRRHPELGTEAIDRLTEVLEPVRQRLGTPALDPAVGD